MGSWRHLAESVLGDPCRDWFATWAAEMGSNEGLGLEKPWHKNFGFTSKCHSWFLSLKLARQDVSIFFSVGKFISVPVHLSQCKPSPTEWWLFALQKPWWFIYVKHFDEHLDLRWLPWISWSFLWLSLSALSIAMLSFFSQSTHKISLSVTVSASVSTNLLMRGLQNWHFRDLRKNTMIFFFSSACWQNKRELT